MVQEIIGGLVIVGLLLIGSVKALEFVMRKSGDDDAKAKTESSDGQETSCGQ